MRIQRKKRTTGDRVRRLLTFSGVRLRHICKGTGITPPLLQYYLNTETPYSAAKLRKAIQFVQRRASRVERMCAILLEKTKSK